MFTIAELVKATGGKLVRGDASIRVRGVSTDTRTIQKEEAFIALRGKNFNGGDFVQDAVRKGARCLVVSPSDARKSNQCRRGVVLIRVQETVKALGDIAAFHRKRYAIPVIAVTGSNGKTTSKDMIAWVLAKSRKVLKSEGTRNNHIGVPQTLLKLSASDDIAVLEIGTNHAGEVASLARIAQPNIGIITNIGPSHLEYFRNLHGVYREKISLLRYLCPPAIACLNSDDVHLQRVCRKQEGKPYVFTFGIQHKADFSAGKVRVRGGMMEFWVGKGRKYKFAVPTVGSYNIYNALAAISVARIVGVGYPEIQERLRSFSFPKGRLNVVTINDIRFIDDTYNSNPLSLRVALETLSQIPSKGRKILVMGDMLELGRQSKQLHLLAGKQAARVCDAFVGVGENAALAADAACSEGLPVGAVFKCQTPDQAREIIRRDLCLCGNDIVLVKGSRSLHMEKVLR
jgi:UDP-N-acetylmuramoyl-tripeptide--D-alanyl-D-alanine ligase